MISVFLFAPPVGYLFLLASWHLLRRHLLAKFNGVSDLPLLQQSRPPNERIRGTAIVCGGSIAGLLTARVCHDHFERVLIVEAEPWVASEEGRKVDGWVNKTHRSRVVQYTSLHSCQCFLFQGLLCLFPNLEEERKLSDVSAIPSYPRFNLAGVPFRVPWSTYKSGLPKTLYNTRGGFETLIRRLVLDRDAYPNIEFIAGTVTDVRPDPTDHSRLNLVVVRTEAGIREFPAVLVADCTGPARAGMKWLERNGYGYSSKYPTGTLPLDQLKISFDQKLRYSTITFRIRPEIYKRLPLPRDLEDTKPIYTLLENSPDGNRRAFVLMRADGENLIAFAGHHGTTQQQPKNLAELKEYARGLHMVRPIPAWIFELMDVLEEVEDSATVSLVRIPPTTYVRYHQAINLPSNWIAVGDSCMTLDPLFAEGCPKAFRGALALHKVLRTIRTTSGITLPYDFSTKFFAEQYDKTDWNWQNTRVMDYGVPTTEPLPGESLSSGASLRWYIAKLQRLALIDEHAGLVLFDSSMGLATAIDAFHPNLIFKIFWRALLGGI
ncbi:hypothetical protein B0H15DRAFT_816167 [Mycena belliarum]|uniref:FAD/NAD(P)-binding domain-containing protein n=1 Tax=Mycena belliarum TaxID=1033014 RepID=A0AAD6UMA8_9AGAR|nr:hypothetical protein B0H15DRAFT_816167 [Mycena belliae]